MKIRTKITSVAIAGLAALGLAGYAIADSGSHDDDAAEHAAFQAATVSLSDAIRHAETETGAKAISAEFEEEDGTYVYEIELLSADGSALEANVDASTGSVLKLETEADD